MLSPEFFGFFHLRYETVYYINQHQMAFLLSSFGLCAVCCAIMVFVNFEKEIVVVEESPDFVSSCFFESE